MVFHNFSKSRGQGAFEYVLLIAGVILIVILAFTVLRSSVLGSASTQLGHGVGNFTQVVDYSNARNILSLPAFSDPTGDVDGDGSENSVDFLLGSGISTSGFIGSLEITVAGSTDLNQLPTGPQLVVFNDLGSATLISFTWDFTASTPLDLRGISVVKEPTSGDAGFVVVNGIPPLPNGQTKTITLNHNVGASDGVCVKDAANLASVSEITGSCTGVDEVLVPCDGLAVGDYACIVVAGGFQVTGLIHSGVVEKEVGATPTPTSLCGTSVAFVDSPEYLEAYSIGLPNGVGLAYSNGSSVSLKKIDSEGQPQDVLSLSAGGINGVTNLSDGRIALVWDYAPSGLFEETDILVKVFNADGSDLSTQVQANSFTTGPQFDSSIAGLSGGGFAVVWQSRDQDSNGNGIFGQLFDSNAVKVEDEFGVNTITEGDQTSPRVAGLADGGFIVVWMSDAITNADVKGQLFDSAGNMVGSEFTIFSDIAYSTPVVVGLPAGGFVVTAPMQYSENESYFAAAQKFDSSANPVGQQVAIGSSIIGADKNRPIALTHYADSYASIVLEGEGISGNLIDSGDVMSSLSLGGGDSYALSAVSSGENIIVTRTQYVAGSEPATTLYYEVLCAP